jgi:hypothetical protein
MAFAHNRRTDASRTRSGDAVARLVTLEGRYHLPDVRDLDHIFETITAFLS